MWSPHHKGLGRFISWFLLWVCHCAEHHYSTASSNTQPSPRAAHLTVSGQLWPQRGSLRTGQESRSICCLYYKSMPWGLVQVSAGTSLDSYYWWLLQCWSHRWEWLSLLGTQSLRAPESLQPENWTLKQKNRHMLEIRMGEKGIPPKAGIWNLS